MNYNTSFIGLFLAVLVLLPGCYHIPTYQRKQLSNVSADFMYCGVENNVILRAKRLTQQDRLFLFGSHNEKLSDSFEVIYFSVHNMSGCFCLLSPADIDLTMALYRDIVQLMKTSSIGGAARVAISAGGAAASYHLAILSVLLGKGNSEAIFPIICFSSIGLGIISIISGVIFLGKTVDSIIMNSCIAKDLKQKTFHDKVIIKSGGQYEGLIFVKSADYTPQFSVTLHEKDNKKNVFTFDVDLRKN